MIFFAFLFLSGRLRKLLSYLEICFFGYKVRFDKQLQKLLFSKVDYFVWYLFFTLCFFSDSCAYLIPKMTSSVAIQYVFTSSKMS